VRFFRLFAAVVAALYVAVPASGSASEDDTILSAVAATGSPPIALDLKGTMRMRGGMMRDASLGNGQSGVPAALSTRDLNKDVPANDTLSQTDLRLRFDPTLHVGTRGAIHGQFEFAGALVMGSDPREPAVLGQATSFGGNGPARGGIGVRRLWATFDLFGMGSVEIGRVPDHFGLGIVRNAGLDPRADFQSDVDRVGLRAELFDLRLALSRDTMASLPHVKRGLGAEDPLDGIEDSTDVIRWLAQIEGGAASGPGFGWGFSLSYQDQAVALQIEHDADPAAKLASGCVQGGTCSLTVPRDASLITPQLYLRYEQKTPLGLLRFQGEGALRVGTIETGAFLANTDVSKTLIGGGFGAELSLRNGSHLLMVRGGGATGDDEGGFGVLDQANFEVQKGGEIKQRDVITGFYLHRGFLVDGLLFREVIGAVANAFYLRPSWRIDLNATDGSHKLWFEGAAVAGLAFAAGSTPGRSRLLGIEPELLAGIDTGGASTALLHASYLVSGSAFNAGENGTAPSNAWRVLAEWHIRF